MVGAGETVLRCPARPCLQRGHSDNHAGGEAAGPTTPPASATAPLGGSVFSVRQPRLGTRLGAGSTTRLQITFAPTSPGAVVATVSIPTSAGVRTVSVSGYGSRPGLLGSAQPLAFGTVATGQGGKSLTLTVGNSWDRPERLTGYGLPRGPTGHWAATGRHRARPTAVADRLRPVRPGATGRLPVPRYHRQGPRISGAARLGQGGHRGRPPGGEQAGRRRRNRPGRARGDRRLRGGKQRHGRPRGHPGHRPHRAFSSAVPMPEGTTIDPGTYLQQPVTFRPTVPGPVSARYVFKSNDEQGPVTVTLDGTGG